MHFADGACRQPRPAPKQEDTASVDTIHLLAVAGTDWRPVRHRRSSAACSSPAQVARSDPGPPDGHRPDIFVPPWRRIHAMTAPSDLGRPPPSPQVTPRRTGGHGRSARPGRVVSALCWAGSLLLVASSVIHFHLWSTGYRHIPTIGPLFLVQTVAGIVVAILVATTRRWLTAFAGALFAIGTIVGLVVSVKIGLFGFRDSFSAPYAHTSLLVEGAAAVVLAAAGAGDLLRRRVVEPT